MKAYIEPLLTCDRVLELFTPEQPTGLQHGDIMRSLGISHGTQEAGYLLSALERLKKDEHLKVYGLSDSHLMVGSDTFVFKALGGYKGYIESENRKEEIRKAIEQSGLKTDKNVRITNFSVRRLNKLLRPISIAQIIVSFATLGVAILAALVSWWAYKANKDSNAAEKRLLLLEARLERIEQSLQKQLPPTMIDTDGRKEIPKK